MSTAIHVNGPAVVAVGDPLFNATHLLADGYTEGSDTLDSPAQLGISEDGVDISITVYDDPVIADTGGPNCPVDLQEMGQTATIRMRLVIFDGEVLKTVRARSGAAEGALPAIGTLIAANLNTFRLLIASTATAGAGEDGPWRFYNAYPRRAFETKVGTKRTIWSLEWFAWALIGNAVVSTSAVPLFDHLTT